MEAARTRASTPWERPFVHVPKATCWPTTGKLAKVSARFFFPSSSSFRRRFRVRPRSISADDFTGNLYFFSHKVNQYIYILPSLVDIDECDYDPDDDQERLCPGICRNTIGSYICVDPDEEPITCPEGYEPNEDDGQCHGRFLEIIFVMTLITLLIFHSFFSLFVYIKPFGRYFFPTDVDECATTNGGCSHFCSNTEGSHRCDCPAGLFLEADNRTCQGF